MKKYNIQYTDKDHNYNWWLTDVMAINEKEAIKQAKFELRDVIGLHIIKYQLTINQ
tara:strand:- start:12 stop:179 length:168 start_codon:yes stop_codon:yes gene_type:complete